MTDFRLGPWPLGLDNVSDPYAASQGALQGAKNVEIDKDGSVDVRPGLVKVGTEVVDSLHYTGKRLLARHGSQIAEIQGNTVTDLFDTGSVQEFGWDTVEDRTYCTTPNGNVVLDPDPRWNHVDEIYGPLLSVNASGGLYAGRYGVAVAVIDGQEGPLSAMNLVELEDGEGIDVSLQPGFSKYRIYRTEANGTVLYHAADTTSTSLTLGVGKLGKVADTRHTRRMVGGRLIRHWHGRLYVAKGKSIYWSSPMREGVTDLRHNFVQFRTRVVMMEPVEEGMFVGTMNRVYYLGGRDPKQWTITPIDSDVIPYASSRLDGSLLDPEMEVPPLPCAIWLSTRGYVIGTPSGNSVQPQAKRLTIPKTASGSVAVHGRRVLALVS